jgi:hypothetical protein
MEFEPRRNPWCCEVWLALKFSSAVGIVRICIRGAGSRLNIYRFFRLLGMDTRPGLANYPHMENWRIWGIRGCLR